MGDDSPSGSKFYLKENSFMSRGIAVVSSSALLSMALLFSNAILAPNISQAQTAQDQGAQMVPAYAALSDNLESSKTKVGDPVRVILSNKVTLKDGTLLPAGTAIVGQVSTDDQQLTGTTKLALRFTKAEIKGGKAVSIKATIVGIFPAESDDISGRPIKPGDEVTSSSLPQHPSSVDEIGALPGVDLHSTIASSNSGVLVSSKRDLKIKRGSEIALSVVAQDTAHGE
jgi:hypothetical protein